MHTALASCLRRFLNNMRTEVLLNWQRSLALAYGAAMVLACSTSIDRLDKPTVPTAAQPEQGYKGAKNQTLDMRQLGGFYYGTSENRSGRLAWLIYLNPEEDSGGLYLPPRVIKLSHLEMSPEGRLSFDIISSNGGDADTFNGQVTSTTISGSFKYSNGRTYDVELHKLDDKWIDHRESGGVSGLYSNMHYSEQTGDLAGVELLLLRKGSDLAGVFTRYEGVPSESYALIDAALSGSMLRFKIQTNGGQETYNGQLSSQDVKLKREDSGDTPYAETLVLPKRMDLLKLMKSSSTAPETK